MTVLRTTAIALSLFMLTTASALAGPPLVTDDAGTVEVGKVEFELNGSFATDKEIAAGVTTKSSRSEAEIKITTGLNRNTGISVAIPYTVSERVREDDKLVGRTDGSGDIAVELKYAFAEQSGINFAIKPSVTVPTGKYSSGLSEGRWLFGGTLIATKEFADGKCALHANIGYEHHSYRTEEIRDANRSDLWSGSIAGETEVGKGLFLAADFGVAAPQDKNTRTPAAYALFGARYQINANLDINAAVKWGVTKPEDDISVQYGLVLKI